MTRESEPRAPASAESGLAGWRRRASPQLPPQLPKRDAVWHGDLQGTEVPRGHRTPSCPLGCEQPWGARGQGGAPHKSPNPEGWASLPKVRLQARDPGARSRLGHETGTHAPSLGLCLSPQTTPGVCPGRTPWTPAAAACEGLAGGPCSRQAHPRPGPPGPRVLGNSMWGSQPCPSPPRSLDPLRPRQTGAEGQTRVYVAFCGTSCVPGTTPSNPPCLIHPRSESCAVLASEEEAEELAHGHTGCDVSSGGAFWHAWSSESQQAARGLCPQGNQGQ